MKYKAYKKDFTYSYAMGSFTVMNLIKSLPHLVEAVFCHEELSPSSLHLLREACKKEAIPLFEGANQEVERVRRKDRELVFAVFQKYQDKLDLEKNHIVLDTPSDMGNLGSIFRSALGFGFYDIAIIGQGADQFHPKTIRASMGALFELRVQRFPSYETYREQIEGEREIFCFMLGSSTELRTLRREKQVPFSLIFGNESAGLDEAYKNRGTPVFIKHSTEIDSLNLGIAASIAMYNFSS